VPINEEREILFFFQRVVVLLHRSFVHFFFNEQRPKYTVLWGLGRLRGHGCSCIWVRELNTPTYIAINVSVSFRSQKDRRAKNSSRTRFLYCMEYDFAYLQSKGRKLNLRATNISLEHDIFRGLVMSVNVMCMLLCTKSNVLSDSFP
jgi:hypothetical protein